MPWRSPFSGTPRVRSLWDKVSARVISVPVGRVLGCDGDRTELT